MVHENLQDGLRQTRLQNESEEYLAKQEEPRLAEIDSVKLHERVAELRRQLPKGAQGRGDWYASLDCAPKVKVSPTGA